MNILPGKLLSEIKDKDSSRQTKADYPSVEPLKVCKVSNVT